MGDHTDETFFKSRDVGLISQEVETVVPEILKTNRYGYKDVAYEKMTPVLVGALQEQINKVKSLKTRLMRLQGS